MRSFLPHIFLFSFSVGRGNTLSAPSRSSSEFVSIELLHPGSPPAVLLAETTQPLLTIAEMAGFRAPSECRRGNCLSCAARLLPGSSWNYATDPDTFLCDEARDAGFILTCCTYPVGPGLKLQLEQQSEAFQIQFYDRLTAGREAGTVASAKTVTNYNMRHITRWMEQTEGQFLPTFDERDASGGDGSGGGGESGHDGERGHYESNQSPV